MGSAIKATWLSIAMVLLSQCTTTGLTSGTPQEQRQAILEMREEVLTELFQLKPDVRSQVGEAAGYGVFSSANINIILASIGAGVGIVRDNSDGQQTYMRMGEVGVGLGAGVKDFRVVFIFHKKESLDRFINQGWTFGGQADAAAKAGDLGAAVGGEAVIDNITVYQLTQSGLALQATVKGTRYWKDSDLN
ncbi:MAG: hypothetical protein JKY98_03315 [Gammaproteobacteria bacterium]|nr:hypothetical protein [Gammaproteobacteria bacterium]